MSAYITLQTPMIDQECLLEALEALGFRRQQIEVHDQPEALVGYEGTRRGQKAHLIIRRQHVGMSSNDLGFLRTELGFVTIVSDYDQSRYGTAWQKQIQEIYADRVAQKQERLLAAQRAAEEEARRAAEAEAERQRETRRQLVEAQRQAIQQKAKALGYRVTESREGNKLRLVLAKRVY